jgi:hypothetical protein
MQVELVGLTECMLIASLIRCNWWVSPSNGPPMPSR